MGAVCALTERTEKQVFTVREVYAEMLAQGTSYAEPTVFKTMQRMKVPPGRPPHTRFDRVGREGFRLAPGI